jgi:hypothetical protein
MLRSTFFAVVVAVVLLGRHASAIPYEIVAKYSARNRDQKVEPISVRVAPGADDDIERVIPVSLVNGKFDGIYLRSPDNAAAELEQLDRITVDVLVGPPGNQKLVASPTVAIDKLKGAPRKEWLLADARTIGAPHAAQVTFRTYLHFNGDYVCDHERRLRLEKGKTPTTAFNPAWVKKDTAFIRWHLWEAALFDPLDRPALYSFCKEVRDNLNWPAIAASARAQVSDVWPASKQVVSSQVVAAMRAATQRATIETKQLAGDTLPHIYDVLQHDITIIDAANRLQIAEPDQTETIQKSLRASVDSGAKLFVHSANNREDICEDVVNCQQVVADSFLAILQFQDPDNEETKTTEVARLSAKGGRWDILHSDLEPHLGERLVVRIVFEAGQNELTIVESIPTSVEDLGLITSFPVVSEIASMAESKPKSIRDFEAKSSVPVSVAIQLGERNVTYGAVTFPWMIGYNPRAAPRLAKIVKGFAHVSLLAPIEEQDDGEAELRLAVGAGVAVFGVFTFGVAVTPQKHGDAFFLAGVSAPDLASMIW